MKNSKSYKQNRLPKTTIKRYEVKEGETIEQKLHRIIHSKEPIKDGAPLIYTERKDGVLPGYNIRTDRFEIALEGTDKIAKSIAAGRAEKAKTAENEGKIIDLNGRTESTQGTEPKP